MRIVRKIPTKSRVHYDSDIVQQCTFTYKFSLLNDVMSLLCEWCDIEFFVTVLRVSKVVLKISLYADDSVLCFNVFYLDK